MDVERLPPNSNLVPITSEEEARWLMAHGTIFTLTRDGVRYRVIDPFERGEPK